MAEKILIGRKEDFPEREGKVVEINGVKYAVFNDKGEISVIDNACPHKGKSLGEGMISEGKVTCPHHGWVFDVKSGQCDFFDAVKVKVFNVSVDEEGKVYMEIPDENKSPDGNKRDE